MGFSRDISAFPEEEIEIIMLALTKDLVIELPSDKEATYLRSRVYAIRTAVRHSWEEKQKLQKKGLSVTHLDKPIINAAQEIFSINVFKDGHTLTIGRRLIRPSMKSILEAAIAKAGGETEESRRNKELEAMNARLSKLELKPEVEADDTLADLGYNSRHNEKKEE